MFKRYADTPLGQIHCRVWGNESGANAPDLVCLHAIPYSGLHFAAIAPLLAQGRRVICPDYPGYGGSDRWPGEASVERYAEAMLLCLDALPVSAKVDLLGFHTGCLVGPEMALQTPGRVRRLVLVDVPYFDPQQRASLKENVGSPPAIDRRLESLEPAWQTNVASKADHLSIDRSLELLAEQLRPGLGAHEGFTAAFSWAAEERLPRVTQPCMVVASASSLAEPSRRAATRLPAATLLENPELGPPVLDRGAGELAPAILHFLDETTHSKST